VLLEQIEFCDVLVLNKCDLVPDDELAEMEAVLETLQPRADVVRAEFGDVPPERLLDTCSFELQAIKQMAGWKEAIREHHHDDHGHDDRGAADAHGVTSFVYARDRPFHPERLTDRLESLPDAIIRAKGFCWVAGGQDAPVALDKAGQSVRAGPNGTWLVNLPPAERGRLVNERPALESELDGEHGDRATELVFIGPSLDPDAIAATLDDCLLTDAEMDDDWSDYPDPFDESTREFAVAPNERSGQ
jgi:G3E family GTPase